MAETEPQTEAANAQPPVLSTGQPETSEAVRRADAILTDVGTRLGGWAARVQHEATRMVARTREELEDMWAEAQAIRHQEGQSAHGDAGHAEGHGEEHQEGHAGHGTTPRKNRARKTQQAD